MQIYEHTKFVGSFLATYDAWDWARKSFKIYLSRLRRNSRVHLIFPGLFLKMLLYYGSVYTVSGFNDKE